MIAGVILAAGMSRRMGQAKMLLPWRGQPLVRHLAQVALASTLDTVVVVTGFAHAAVGAALGSLPLQTVRNPNYEAGQSTSLIAGLQALHTEVTAAIVLLVDQPLITPAIIDALVAEHRQTPEQIIAPSYAGRRGNPVLFPRATWTELWRLTGDAGARSVLEADPSRLRLIPVTTSAVVDDADTPAEYAALKERDQQQQD